jgi:hypothetical protein
MHPPIYSASILEVRIHIYTIQIHPENSFTLLPKNIPITLIYPLLANKAPNIQLYYHLLLYPRKRLGCSKKREIRRNKRKRINVPL